MQKLYVKIRVLGLLVIAVIVVLFRKSVPTYARSILIIQMAKLGDMVCTTPMFRSIKQNDPKRTLIVLGDAINEEVLSGNPYVDTYIVAKPSIFTIVRRVRAYQIDAVCITSPNFEFLAISILARIPLIVVPRIQNGWSPYETLAYKLLSTFVITVPHRMESYAPREYLRLLEPIGVYEENTHKEVYFTPSATLSIRRFLETVVCVQPHEKVIGILPGAGNEIKTWSAEKYATLMNSIAAHDTDVRFLILGSTKDQNRATVVLNAIAANVRVTDAIGVFSLDELKAVIAELYMVIGADTGPQYIAEALGVPTIDIVGPVDEREQPPMGELHYIVKSNRTAPQLYVMNARSYDPVEARRQTDDISAEMVYEVYGKLVNAIEKNNLLR